MKNRSGTYFDGSTQLINKKAFIRNFGAAFMTLLASYSLINHANAQQMNESTKVEAKQESQSETKSKTTDQEPQQVQEVEIQAYKLKKTVLGKSSLSGEELVKMPGSGGDPLKAMQNLPGIALNNDGFAGAAVRGARPWDNAYYVDGLPVGYLFHMGGFVSVFNPDLIRRFDLYSAAWSPEYGDVVGGVFDIALRNPRTDRIGGKASMSLLTSSLLLEGPLSENTSFFLSGRRSVVDLLVKEVKDEKAGTSFTFPSYNDVQGRFLWNLNNKNNLRFDLLTAQDSVKFDLKKNALEVQHEPVLVGESALASSYNNAAVTWESELGSQTNNQLSLGRTAGKNKTRIGSAGYVATNYVSSYLREKFTTTLAKNHQLTAGVNLSSTLIDVDVDIKNPRCTEFDPDCDATSASVSKIKRQKRDDLMSAYVNDRWSLTPQWALIGGLRATRDDYLKENNIDPRLGLEFSYSPQTVFSFGLGRHHQAPTKEQTFTEVGNPYLKSIRSTQVALGVSQSLEHAWSWRAEVYKKEFDQFVISDPIKNYRNGGSGSAYGLEVLLKKEMGYGLTGFVSLSLSKAKRKNDTTGENFSFGYDQPVIANAVLQYKPSDKIQYGARWSYHTGQPDTPIIGNRKDADGRIRPVYGALNSERFPAYHRLDLRVDYRYSPKLSFYGELINAYARKNVGGYEYSADYKTRKPEGQMPLFPSLGFEYKF